MKILLDNINDIYEKLLDAFGTHNDVRVIKMDITKVINRPFSDVAFLDLKTSNGNRKLVLKKTKHHPENISITMRENQAVVEFEILQKLYPKFESVSRCNVPKPLLLLPEYEAYVMEFVDGHLLADLFGGAKYYATRRKFSELTEYYYLCGVWLKKLHEFTGVRTVGIDALSYTLDRCDEKLRLTETAGNFAIPTNFVSHVQRILEMQLRLLTHDDIMVTGRHGDFGSWNILVNSEGITVLDFLGFREDLICIDILKMLVTFEIEKTYLFFSKNRIDILKNSFIQGYGTLPLISPSVLKISEIFHRVCSVCACVTKPPINHINSIEQKFCLNNNLAWLMSDHDNLIWPRT